MNTKLFNVSGWILLLGMVALWLMYGYTDWQLVLLPAAFICFSIGDGKLKMLKRLSVSHIILLVLSFVLSVAIAFGLIQLFNYLIHAVFQLQGTSETLFEWLAVILSVIPVSIAFGSIINKIDENVKGKHSDSPTNDVEYEGLKREANELLASMTKIQAIKLLRERHGLSLVDAKNIVDAVC